MGLSPYDKKRYKESKRRRRQALLQSETGYIVPYRQSKKPLIIIICVAVALCVAVSAVLIACNAFRKPADNTESREKAELTQEELLRVVNRMHPLEEDFVPPLDEAGGVEVHEAIADDLRSMLEKADEKGIALKVTDGYVSFAGQKNRYEKNLAQFKANPKYTPVRAQAAAQRIVPQSGCSEAQTGLLVSFDVSDSRVKSFVERECIKYGFILRYPEGKDELTHIQPNESVYRYVGADNAAKMRSFDMCLEEYSEYLKRE